MKNSRIKPIQFNQECSPLPQATEQTIKDFIHPSPLQVNFTNAIHLREERQNSEAAYFQCQELAKQYIDRACPNPDCRQYQSILGCINKCIFPNNNIQVELLDETFVYLDFNYQKTIISLEDVDALFTTYNKNIIPEERLIGTFHIDTDPSQITTLKKLLLRTSFKNFIQTSTRGFSDNEIHDILNILLMPTGTVLNPIPLASLEIECLLDNKNNISDSDFDRIRLQLKNSKDARCVPQNWFGMSHEKMQHLFFPTSLDDFYLSYPYGRSSKLFQTLVKDLSFLHTLRSLPQKEFDRTFANVARFLYDKIPFLFQLYPPYKNELIALFYCHRNQYIKYATPKMQKFSRLTLPISINFIRHIAAIRILSSSPPALETQAQYATNNQKFTAFMKFKKEVYHQLLIEDYDSNVEFQFGRIQNQCRTYVNRSQNPYGNLRSILTAITDSSISILEQLMALIGKLYVGHSLHQVLSNETAPYVTLIYCENPYYVKRFLEEICFNYITKHSLRSLTNDKNLPDFIITKGMGCLANIDTTELNSIPQNMKRFKALARGIKTSVKEEQWGQISHRNAIHYIFIARTRKTENTIFKDIPHDVITLPGAISQSLYQPLKQYEAITFAAASVCWLINECILFPQQKNIPTAYVHNMVPDLDDTVLAFLDKFCTDSTVQIPPIDKKTIASSHDKKKMHETVTRLGITKLPFTSSEDFRYAFKHWFKATYNEDYTDKDTRIIHTVQDILGSLFYLKKNGVTYEYRSLETNKSSGARGFYGIKIKTEELKKYIETKESTQLQESALERQKKFTQYLENLLNTSIPYVLAPKNEYEVGERYY